ncbi:MAG: cyclic lactone autoinducer peptide [Oscillospiraceae bacterium]|nr:cyclic lactone autoinducer peptide [Oscillospiraceae bacterium]
MKIKKNMKKALEVLSNAAMKSTEKAANSSCHFWQYQAKESEKIKNMRKF